MVWKLLFARMGEVALLMKFRLDISRLALVLAIVFGANFFISDFSAAAPKAGAKCTKKGKTEFYKAYEYVCVKKNGKLVWSKGKKQFQPSTAGAEVSSSPKISPSPEPTTPAIPLPMPTPKPSAPATPENFVFADICEKDPFIPQQWLGIEELVNTWGHECSWPYRIVKKYLGDEKPLTALSENVQAISTCKLPDNPKKNAMVAWPGDYLDFWMRNSRHPSMNSTIQLVPIYSKDAPDNGNDPYQDYKPYIDFLTDWVDHASDGKGKLTVSSPKRYIEFPENIRDYKLTHERPESIAANFRSALEKYIAPQINFSGAPTALIVLPPGSDFSLTQQVGLGQSRIGNDFVRWSIHPPFTLKGPLGPGSNFIHPAWWLHELHHVTAGFDDTDKTSDQGLHMWGLMSYGSNEMLGWQKWLIGLWSDERVFCADAQKGGIYWIVPSTYQSDKKKLVALRISNSKVILIESMRAGGLSYKMPKWMEGVLVYGVENTTVDQHTGTFVVKPDGRLLTHKTLSGMSRKFINSDAALKNGETASIDGYKVTVIESGAFGDVVRVERA